MNGTEVSTLPTGYGVYLLQTILALGAVCLLAYVVLRFGLNRLYGGSRRGQSQLLRVVERLPLDPRRSLYLVEVAGRYVLLGTGDSGVRFLTEVDGEGLSEVESEAPPEDEPEEPEDELTTTRADHSPNPG